MTEVVFIIILIFMLSDYCFIFETCNIVYAIVCRSAELNLNCVIQEMTLEEYEKVLEEKRKALNVKTDGGRKVDTKEFESLKPLSCKKENDEIFAKLVSFLCPSFTPNLQFQVFF